MLKDLLDVAVYEHYLLFHYGITILLSQKYLSTFGSDFAGNMLSTFVNHSPVIYGRTFLIYNVHSLAHYVMMQIYVVL